MAQHCRAEPKDERQKPIALFRIKVQDSPVALRRDWQRFRVPAKAILPSTLAAQNSSI